MLANLNPGSTSPSKSLKRFLAALLGWSLLASGLATPAEAASEAKLETRAKGLLGKTYASRKAFDNEAEDVLGDSRRALPDSSYDRKVETRTLPDGEISKTDPGTGFKMTRKVRRTQDVFEKWKKGETETKTVSGTYRIDRGAKRPEADWLKAQIRAKHSASNQSVSDFDFDWKDAREKVDVDYVLTTEKRVEERKFRKPSRDDLKARIRGSVTGSGFDFQDFDFNDNRNRVTVTYSFERKVEVTKYREVKECSPRYREECERVKVGEDCRQVRDGEDCDRVQVGEKCSGSGRNRRCEPVYERRCRPRYRTVCEPRYERRCRQVRDGEDCKTVKKAYTDTETKTFKNQSMSFDYEAYTDVKTVKDRDRKSASFAYLDNLDEVNGSVKYVVADTKRYEKPVKEEPYGNWKVHYVVPPPSPFTEDSASSVNRSLDFGIQTTQTRKTLSLPFAVAGGNSGDNPGGNSGGNPGGTSISSSGTSTVVEFKSVPYGPGGANKKVVNLSIPSVSEAPVKTYVTQASEWTTVANMSTGSRTTSSAAGNRTLYSSELTSNPSVVLGGSTSRKQSGADNSRASLPATKPASSGSTFGAFKKLAIEDLVPAGQAKKADKDLDDDDEEDDEKDRKNDKKKDEKKTHDPGKGKKGD